MKKRSERIVFYSCHDMVNGYELRKIENLLKNIDINDSFDINDFLEFFSIKKYFDNELFLVGWDNETKCVYIDISRKLFQKAAEYFNKNIDNKNIKNIINEVEFHYTELFYDSFHDFKIYEKIQSKVIADILNEKPYLIEYLLKYKKVVTHYHDEINIFLQSYDKTTELFLDKLEGNDLYFPEELTSEMKEAIILKYLEKGGKENMNKLEHISKLRNSNFLNFKLNKIKILAKRKHEELVKDFFKGNTGTKYGYTVGLSEKQEEYIKIENSNPLEPKITYSINLFNTLYENNGISYLFRSIFNFLDNRGNIELVARKSEISVLMDLVSGNIHGEYKTGPQFEFKEVFSMLKIVTFVNYIKNIHDKDISSIIEYFILNLKMYDGFNTVIFRTDDFDKLDNYYSKIKIIIPEFDLFVKQFICYVEEGKIDFELIGIEDSFLYENIPSLLGNKYFYEKDEKLKGLKYHFFSDQSGLFYIEGFEGKYKNFYSLITKENLKLDNFHDYQIDILNILIKENILYIDEKEFIKIVNKTFIFLVGEIHKKEVLSYYGYKKQIQAEILEMEKLGYLYKESKLLSHLESQYFNYYLKDYFPNSHGIRNKNLHGNYYGNENSAYNDFMIVLKLIVLIFLKIEDELYYKEKIA